MSGKIGIGIDTGGTYTDAVVYDFGGKTVLGASKAPTTRYDLSAGILQALDKLSPELLREAGVVALSTTLATNACVEDKGGRAKLVFFGGDAGVIDEFGPQYGLPEAEQIHIQEAYTGFYGETLREPDWELFGRSVKEKFKHLDGAGIVEIYAMKNSGAVEKKAKEIFRQHFDIPVVCGHELFSELNSLQRGASTLLNARLFPVVKEFLAAIKKSMALRGINAPVVIVRSDGSLMSEEFAAVRPVETLLSGPAASTSGGLRLSGEKNCVIVDMGGTTTDISLAKNGFPVENTGGVSIGKWKTFVHGFMIKTLGLGGDSAVHYNGGGLYLEEYRVVPLCVAAAGNPRIVENLKSLVEQGAGHSLFVHEHFMLARSPQESSGTAGAGRYADGRYAEKELRFLEALKSGPLSLKEAADVLDTDIYNLNVSRLVKEGAAAVCGLTPTDIMHIRGDFNYQGNVNENIEEGSAFSKEASLWGARFAALNLGLTVDGVCEKVYEEIRKKLYVNIVKALLENGDRHYAKNGISGETERFILKSYEYAKERIAGNGSCAELLSLELKTGLTLVGAGAPVHVFLHDVAKLLGTKAVVPEYASIANALGAVTSRVRASFTAEIRPEYSAGGITGYRVFGYGSGGLFKTLKDAGEFARKEAEEGAREEAKKRGVQGILELSFETNKNEGNARDGVFYMGSGVTAHVTGELGA